MPSFLRRTLTVCLSSLLVGSAGISVVGANRAAAAELPTDSTVEPTAQKPLTLRELLERLENRPPAVEAPNPAASQPDTEPRAVPDIMPQLEVAEQAVRLRLNLSDRKVYVYRGDNLEKSYPVAIGRPGWETPTGEFEVFSQIVDPGWTNPLTDEVMAPGPDNPLGDRWIAFWTDGVNSIGFHGTPNRNSVGQAASHGCIRMYNEDVRELFEIVALGTPVVVEP